MLISLIVPCYNEEEAMPLFYQEAARVAAQMEKSHGAEFEIIFVDDGSKDGTLRVAGQTKWNFWSLFKYSIEGIVGFSTQPLVMAALAGVIFCLAAFVGIIFVVVRALIFGDPTAGWPSMVCIMLLCSGVQLFCLGIVGEYLAKTYLEVKHRPIYITRETEQDRDERKPAQQK